MRSRKPRWQIAAFAVGTAYAVALLVTAVAHRAWGVVGIFGALALLCALGPAVRAVVYGPSGAPPASPSSGRAAAPGQGTLRLTRRTGILAVWRPVTIRISEQLSVDLTRNETRDIALQPGSYELTATVRRVTSNALDVNVPLDGAVDVVIGYTGPQPAATRNVVLALMVSNDVV